MHEAASVGLLSHTVDVDSQGSAGELHRIAFVITQNTSPSFLCPEWAFCSRIVLPRMGVLFKNNRFAPDGRFVQQ